MKEVIFVKIMLFSKNEFQFLEPSRLHENVELYCKSFIIALDDLFQVRFFWFFLSYPPHLRPQSIFSVNIF